MRLLEKTISIEILKYCELTRVEKIILKTACQTRLNAQAPYSHYWVGSAILAVGLRNPEQHLIFSGCNVENVNWSETVHAEENAISTAVSKLGPCRILAVAVIGAPENTKVTWPPSGKHVQPGIKDVSNVCPSCGHCLQVIAENCFDLSGQYDPGVSLLGYKVATGEIYRTTIGNALPMPFIPKYLGVNYVNDPRFKKHDRK